MDDEEGCYRAPLLERWTPHGANVTRVNVPLITLINEALCLVEASMATNGNACAISITSVRARVTRLLSNSREFHRSSILIPSGRRRRRLKKGGKIWEDLISGRSLILNAPKTSKLSTATFDREKGGNMKIWIVINFSPSREIKRGKKAWRCWSKYKCCNSLIARPAIRI